MLDEKTIRSFRAHVQGFYGLHGRHDLPWRLPEQSGRYDPYKILISEVMLQQTQVNRVVAKYLNFINNFPRIESLAEAPLGDVLRAWNGLGYNRRAKFLHEAAKKITMQYNAVFPETVRELVALPGIGSNTAGAILAYAFNEPVVFIETNIRTVYIHHFLSLETLIPDSAIRGLVEQTLVKSDPRNWYWGLMDYGTYLKRTAGNPNAASKSYSKQSQFSGSKRQLRGQIIRLLSHQPYSLVELQRVISDERLLTVLRELEQEGLISNTNTIFNL